MKTAAAYIRVSTSDQMEYSPDSQLKCIREYAEKNGYLLPEALIFQEEDGISGRGAGKRTQFQRMIACARRKPCPFSCILLWKFSRFARSRTDSVLYKSLLRRQGIEVISVSEPLGPDKTSILVEAMIEAMDEYYSVNLAEEVRRGMREKISRGEPVTAPPFGYRMAEKRYVPDPAEAAAVRRIYSDFLSGLGCGEIAEKLNAAGLRTRRDRPWESRAVRYILRNPAYAGRLRWNAAGPLGRRPAEKATLLVEDCHEPLVAPALWTDAQKRLQTQTTARRQSAPGMLHGLVRCGSCGSLLVTSSRGSYQCCGYCHGACGISHSISARKLEAMVTALLKNDLTETEIPIRLPADGSGESGLLRLQLRREHLRLSRLREAYLCGAETLEMYEEEQRKISQSCLRLKTALEQCGKESAGSVPERIDVIEALCSDDFSPAQKNLLLRSFVSEIVYDRPAERLSLYYR